MRIHFRQTRCPTYDLWSCEEDVNCTCCLSWSQSSLFDPATATHSSLKWSRGSMHFFYDHGVMACSTGLPAYLSTLNIATVLMLRLSTYHHSKTSFLCRLGKAKLEPKDLTDRDISVMAGSNNPSDLSLVIKPKSPLCHIYLYCQRVFHLYTIQISFFCLTQLGQSFRSTRPSEHLKSENVKFSLVFPILT